MTFSNKKRKNGIFENRGVVAVEVLLSLLTFVFAMIVLINFIGIMMVHNKVQYAINSAANEIAAYSYLYSALGIQGAEQQFKSDFSEAAQKNDDAIMSVVDSYNAMSNVMDDIGGIADGVGNTVNDVTNVQLSTDSFQGIMDDINNIESQIENAGNDVDAAKEALNNMKEKISTCFENPKDILAGFVYMGASTGISLAKNAIAMPLAKTLTKEFLDNDYLIRSGVVGGFDGLDFWGSSIFTGPDFNMIDIEVRYELEVGLLGFFVNNNPNENSDEKKLTQSTITVVQRVTIPAWLDGDGEQVSDHIGE